MVRLTRSIIAFVTSVVLMATSAGCQAGPAAGGVAATGTPTPVETTTPTMTATKTRIPTRTPRPRTPTLDPEESATAVAKARSVVIKDLYDQKLINSDQGEYYQLESLDESWAQLFWYRWWDTGFNTANFVIQADVSWDSASNIANWFNSGCGFVYNVQDNDNHHITYLGMDGYVYSSRFEHGYYTDLKRGYYDKLKTPSDSATLTLIVENRIVTFLVNGKKSVSFDDSRLTGGNVAYTLVSGTNKDYGTHCSFENVELWLLPEEE